MKLFRCISKTLILRLQFVTTVSADLREVSLKAGEEKSVEFTISNKAMNIVDEDGNRYIAGKHFRLFAGVSQPDTRSAELTGHKPAEVEIAL